MLVDVIRCVVFPSRPHPLHVIKFLMGNPFPDLFFESGRYGITVQIYEGTEAPKNLDECQPEYVEE